MDLIRKKRRVIHRTEAIEKQRTKLPAVMMEQEIVEAVKENHVVIISGDTGCGKSTQVPQFLYEAGFGQICVTQPRRVAALSLAKRVAEEMNNEELVGYQVRYDKKNNTNASIKFETDGILLKEIQSDFLLKMYDVVIIDEAHERSINCDILLGLLSRSIAARADRGHPLKLVIMSATLRLSDFVENKRLFPNNPPPVVSIAAKTYPVNIHYEKTTEEDYVEAAYGKVLDIHRKLPAGSILVFLTGRHEILELVRMLKTATAKSNKRSEAAAVEDTLIEDSAAEDSEGETGEVELAGEDEEFDDSLEENRGKFSLGGVSGEPIDCDEEKTGGRVKRFVGESFGGKLKVVPLYAQLSNEAQMRAFEVTTDARTVIVSSNVAEAALTLPNVRYVVDCGKEKRREFFSSGVSRFRVVFESKASANQRAGRAGRVGEGHCYRLFSTAVFAEHMADFPPVEITQVALDHPLLFMASLGITEFKKFPWVTRPSDAGIVTAVNRLQAVGAFTVESKLALTELGRAMATLPVAPRHALMLLRAARRPEVLSVACAAVAGLTVGEIFEEPPPPKCGWRNCATDIDALVWAVCAWLCTPASYGDRFCEEHGLRPRAVTEAASLAQQLWRVVSRKLDVSDTVKASAFRPVDNASMGFLRDCIVEGLIDRIAVKSETEIKKYRTSEGVDAVIHNQSRSAHERHTLVAFNEIIVKDKASIMRTVVPVDPSFLAKVKSSLIERGKIVKFPPPMRLADGRMMGFFQPIYRPLEFGLGTVEMEISGV
jgi:ATP-dependent RNA helicase DHX37/DHR1